MVVVSMIPMIIGVSKVLGEVYLFVRGKVYGMVVRVLVLDGSLMDMVVCFN